MPGLVTSTPRIPEKPVLVQFSDRFRNPTVACLGLAYKANVDDLRESPAIDIVVAIAEAQRRAADLVQAEMRKLPPNPLAAL